MSLPAVNSRASLLVRGLAWNALFAAAVAGLIVVGVWPVVFGKGDYWVSVFPILTALLFTPLAGLRVMSVYRSLGDRIFTVLGFLATFTGLTMLVVFFWEIGGEAAGFFRHTPELVQKQNEALRNQVKNIDRLIADEISEVRRQMDLDLKLAATEEEKKEVREQYETDIIPSKLKAMEQTRDEVLRGAQQGQRDDVSAWGVFRHFLTHGPSNEPQDAGIWPAVLGSLLVVLVSLVAIPFGVGAALYLEEYGSQRSWLGRVIQININNLAGIPSIVFGILGDFVFVLLIFRPLEHEFDWIAARNVLGGGLTLALLTLPVVIVSAQEAIRAVPQSIRHGSLALGATHWQTIWSHVLPLSLPGILTGTILSVSRAIGEAAPLVMFGALLFVNQDPTLFSRFTVLPMQIFGWTDRPPIVFEGQALDIWKYNAAVASILLMVMLLGLNAIAIILRNRFQKRARW